MPWSRNATYFLLYWEVHRWEALHNTWEEWESERALGTTCATLKITSYLCQQCERASIWMNEMNTECPCLMQRVCCCCCCWIFYCDFVIAFAFHCLKLIEVQIELYTPFLSLLHTHSGNIKYLNTTIDGCSDTAYMSNTTKGISISISYMKKGITVSASILLRVTLRWNLT